MTPVRTLAERIEPVLSRYYPAPSLRLELQQQQDDIAECPDCEALALVGTTCPKHQGKVEG